MNQIFLLDMTTSNFQLESLTYQTDGVVRVFEGTPPPAAHELAGNRCGLLWQQLKANLIKLAQRHRISDEPLNNFVLEAALDTTGKWNLHHQLGDGLVEF
jgi:hypothetical protein